VFINEATTPRQLHINIKGGGSIKKLGVQNIANFHGVPEGKQPKMTMNNFVNIKKDQKPPNSDIITL
uniref:Uncharacterized protein n=1 Tax=Megaselia scalaris TaxID=36166 RepID=T1GQG6_MEGSC